MRYFRLFDEMSGPEGDVYRWNGSALQMELPGQGWGFADIPPVGKSVEQYLAYLAGPNGRFAEVPDVG